MAKGSIILKIIIILLALLLVAVIALPQRIWNEEDILVTQSRKNMNAIYEAQKFFHQKTGHYTDDLDTLITVIQNDTSLQQKKRLVNLTHEIYDIMENTLEIPSIAGILLVSGSVSELQSDLLGNDRYFEKYVDLDESQKRIFMNLTRFDSSAAFPQFCKTKTFVDSLNDLKNRINEYRLQNSAYLAETYLDSIHTTLPKVEKDAIRNFWDNLHLLITQLIKDAEQTDIRKVTNIIDRLQRANERINSAILNLLNADIQSDLAELSNLQSEMNSVYQKYISSEQFQLTQRFGLLELTETDSTLLNLNRDDFTSPDDNEKYIVDAKGEHLIIESPNLLDKFASKNREIVEPIRNSVLFKEIESIQEIIDSTNQAMTETVPLIRRHGNVLLDMKETMAELKDLNSVPFYKMANDLNTLVDTIETEKKISVLKPMFEETLNPIDTLAARIRNKNIGDLEERLNYLGNEIKGIDSLLSSSTIPSRVRRRIKPIYPIYEPVFSILNDMKSSMNDELANKIETVSENLEKSLVEVLNGYSENVYVIFQKKHINPGYIKDNVKSWEEEQ